MSEGAANAGSHEPVVSAGGVVLGKRGASGELAEDDAAGEDLGDLDARFADLGEERSELSGVGHGV